MRNTLDMALRAQRVQAARQQSGPRVNPIFAAIKNSARLTPTQVETELAAPQQAMDAMRKATHTRLHWLQLATAYNHADAVNSMRVVTVPKIYLQNAENALKDIEVRSEQRDGSWKPSALRGYEIKALMDLIVIFKTMLGHLYQHEWRTAQHKAQARVLSAQGQVIDPTTTDLSKPLKDPRT